MVDDYLAADGIENVIRVLEDLEDEKYRELEFVELDACAGGCVGGVLQVENPYIARAKMKKLRRYLPVSRNHLPSTSIPARHAVGHRSGIRPGAGTLRHPERAV